MADPTEVNGQVTDLATPTSVNGQVTDAAAPTTVNSQVTDLAAGRSRAKGSTAKKARSAKRK